MTVRFYENVSMPASLRHTNDITVGGMIMIIVKFSSYCAGIVLYHILYPASYNTHSHYFIYLPYILYISTL